jgi:uncharacterized protein (TIGR02231 family)
MTENTGMEAPITAVTVFRDGARITRSGQITLPTGLSAVQMPSLPVAADPESVRVAVRGQEAGLLEVEANRRFGTDPLRADIVRLRSEAESWRDAVQALDDDDAAEQARLGFAGHLSEAAAVAMARAVSFGRAGHDDLAQMAAHLSTSTATALERRRDIHARRRAAQRELETAEQRLDEAERRAGPVEFVEVTASVEAAAQTPAEVELSYHVEGASWQPLYDLGLTGERMTASYLAEVTQRTGEDWPAVRLVLSTARSGQYQTLPELSPWYISRRAAEPRRSIRGRALAARVSVPTAGAQQPEAAAMTAEVGESGANQIYEVARPIEVPADGNPHKTTIAQFDLDADIDYLAVPVLAAEAYLRATVTNSSPVMLLPGPARVFRDGQFTGETRLETIAPGEEFELQLGVDDQIRIERKLHRRATSKAVIGGTRTVDVAFETTVRNHRVGAAKISVHDHIPVSTDADIKVRLRETSPSPAEQTDLGELTWELTLEAGQSATIRQRFTVEHPAQVSIAGL